jgi:hypothetical protein
LFKDSPSPSWRFPHPLAVEAGRAGTRCPDGETNPHDSPKVKMFMGVGDQREELRASRAPSRAPPTSLLAASVSSGEYHRLGASTQTFIRGSQF